MINRDGVTQEVRAALTNLVTVLGVAVFGWSAGALLVVYWVEAGVALVRGILQGPFARRDPEDMTAGQQTVRDTYIPLSSWDDKRGGVSIGPLPPIYPRNVSTVLNSAMVTLIFWPIAGGLVIATVGAEFPIGTVLLAVIGVVAGHTVGLIDYFRNDRYVENTVGSAMSRRYTIGIFVLGVGGVFVLSRASPPSVLFLIVAVGKLLADLAIARAEASNDPVTGWDEESLDEQVPEGEPTAVFEGNRRNLLLRAAGMAPFFILIPPYMFVGLAAVVAGLFGGLVAGVAVFAVGIVVAMLSLAVRTDVERGHLEYHVYPERIVAYDRLLDAPQWSVDRTKIEEASIKPSRLDRIRPGSRTVVVSTYGDDRRFRALRRPGAFIDASSSGSGETRRSSNTYR
ncbi:MAG: DUF6498-containing protein [Halobacteriales archaeon]